MNSTDIIFISQFFSQKSFGASKVTISNFELLSSIYNLKTISWAEKSISEIKINSSRSLFNKLLMLVFGFSGNLSLSVFASFIKILPSLEKKQQIIWFDSSLLGPLVFLFNLFGFKTIVFFHNCELDLLDNKSNTVLTKFRNRSIRKSELLSIRYAGKIVSISQKDSERIKLNYDRSVDLVLAPMINKVHFLNNCYQKRIGFLGSNWAPNLYAVNFILELAKELPEYEFYIGGEICNRVNNSIPQNVKLLGYIDDIEIFYKNVHTILSPVVFGGGIKIKVLEAIQYSKLVIGSDHSITGFESYEGICYLIANKKKDYISLIKNNTGVFHVSSTEIINVTDSSKNSLTMFLNNIFQEFHF